jgi:hypothetical protein
MSAAACRRGGRQVNLLCPLNEHAGIEAKIMPPENWKNPAADTPESVESLDGNQKVG